MDVRRFRFPTLHGSFAVITILALCGACGSNGPDGVRSDTATSSDASAHGYLIGNIQAMSHAVDRRILARNLPEYLPNQEFVIDKGQPAPEADVVVLGTVTAAHGARGFYVPGDAPDADASTGTETEFEDSRAQWRVIELTVAIKDSVGSPVGQQEHVGVVVDGADHKRLVAEAAQLGDVVLVLEKPGFFKFDEKLRQVDNLGTLIGQVAPDGTLGFPALGEDGSQFMGDLTTWPAIEAEFAEEKKPITTDLTGIRDTD